MYVYFFVSVTSAVISRANVIVLIISDVDSSPGNSGHGPARSRDRNERGETAMHVAAIKGDQDGIKKLLDQGMSPNVPDFAG